MYKVTLNESERWFHTLEEARDSYACFKELKLTVGGSAGDLIRLEHYCEHTGESLLLKGSQLEEIDGCFDEAGLPSEQALSVDTWMRWVDEKTIFEGY